MWRGNHHSRLVNLKRHLPCLLSCYGVTSVAYSITILSILSLQCKLQHSQKSCINSLMCQSTFGFLNSFIFVMIALRYSSILIDVFMFFCTHSNTKYNRYMTSQQKSHKIYKCFDHNSIIIFCIISHKKICSQFLLSINYFNLCIYVEPNRIWWLGIQIHETLI